MPRQKVLSTEFSPVKIVLAPGKLRNLDKEILKYVSTKQVSLDIVEIFRTFVNPYIPSDSGTLRENGYNIELMNNKKIPKGKLSYRNTADVPYVLYQYAGRIWKPVYAPFVVSGTPDGKAHCKWTGEWKSSKKYPRHETAIKFRRKHEARWFKAYGLRYKVDFYGYKNGKSQPHWVEYAAEHTDWSRSVERYAENVYANAINQIAAAKRARAEENSKRTIKKILGFTPNKAVKTRIRKKT